MGRHHPQSQASREMVDVTQLGTRCSGRKVENQLPMKERRETGSGCRDVAVGF